MERKYKPLRPAIRSPTGGQAPDGPAQRPDAAVRKKRVHVKVACDACRAKKTACDGQRPSCGPCVKRGSSCTFRNQSGAYGMGSSSSSSAVVSSSSSPGQGRDTKASQALRALMSSSDDRAIDILAQLRKGEDPFVVLEVAQSLSGFDNSRQPGQAGSPFVSAPDQNSIEFELMVRHPMTYPTYVSLDSSLYTKRPSRRSEPPTTFHFEETDTSEPNPEQDSPEEQAAQAAAPLPPMQTRPPEPYCDSRIGRVRFRDWTDILISDAKAARVISRYIEVDHPILGLFDADLFLHDLVNQRSRYCTTLLINALLGWACLAFAPAEPSEPNHAARFYDKALNIFHEEQGASSVTTVAGLQLLSLTATYSGQGETGMQLLREAIVMGKRMRLLTDGSPLNDETAPQGDDLTAACQTAWGLFCHATMHSLHCQGSELESLRPPVLSIPGGVAVQEKGKELSTTVHDMVCQYYSRDEAPRRRRFETGFVQEMAERLLAWGDNLPTTLARGNRSTHDIIVMHIYFHISMTTLLRPLMQRQGSAPLAVGSVPHTAIEGVYAASANQLKRLMTVYQSHFCHEWPTVNWHTACLSTANAVLRAPESEPYRRHYFDGAIEGYCALYSRFPIAIALIKGLMAMAITSGLVTSTEAYDLVNKLRDGGGHHELIAEPTEACFVVDLALAASDQAGGHVDYLAQKFDEMAMFDELTFGRAGKEDDDVEVT